METQEMIEVMQAFADGKKIECKRNPVVTQTVAMRDWSEVNNPCWDWLNLQYRVAPEPKKEGRWERIEIVKDDGQYCLANPIADVYVIDALPRVPGFGGIDYQSPFDPKVTVRSMAPRAFSRESGVHFSVGIQDDDRPGIPVAAWFWREEE